MVDKELIEIWRNMLKPSVSLWLLNTNYEEMGEQDKEEFERDFDEILDLALTGLKHKAQLSKEGTTKDTTSDLISKQAVSSWLKQYGQDVLHGKYKFSLMYIWKNLMDLPSAQPERKKGQWIVNVEKENTISGSCSACGWQAHLYEDDVVGMDFCPNCGAKMEE